MHPALAGKIAISFDVGGTLIDPWPSVGHIYAEVAKKLRMTCPAPDLVNSAFREAWKKKNSFNYTRSEWKSLVSSALKAPVSDEYFSAVYNRFIESDAWQVYTDVAPCLAEFRSRGYRLGIISNWDERLRPLLKNTGLTQYFDSILVSTEVGAHKPDPRIFGAALQELSISAGELLHIGDNMIEDFKGAQALGITSLLISRGKSRDGISSLTELLA